MMDRKSWLIGVISQSSNDTGDRLLDFMELYDLDNLMDAKEEQLEQYVADYVKR